MGFVICSTGERSRAALRDGQAAGERAAGHGQGSAARHLCGEAVLRIRAGVGCPAGLGGAAILHGDVRGSDVENGGGVPREDAAVEVQRHGLIQRERVGEGAVGQEREGVAVLERFERLLQRSVPRFADGRFHGIRIQRIAVDAVFGGAVIVVRTRLHRHLAGQVLVREGGALHLLAVSRHIAVPVRKLRGKAADIAAEVCERAAGELEQGVFVEINTVCVVSGGGECAAGDGPAHGRFRIPDHHGGVAVKLVIFGHGRIVEIVTAAVSERAALNVQLTVLIDRDRAVQRAGFSAVLHGQRCECGAAALTDLDFAGQRFPVQVEGERRLVTNRKRPNLRVAQQLDAQTLRVAGIVERTQRGAEVCGVHVIRSVPADRRGLRAADGAFSRCAPIMGAGVPAHGHAVRLDGVIAQSEPAVIHVVAVIQNVERKSAAGSDGGAAALLEPRIGNLAALALRRLGGHRQGRRGRVPVGVPVHICGLPRDGQRRTLNGDGHGGGFHLVADETEGVVPGLRRRGTGNGDLAAAEDGGQTAGRGIAPASARFPLDRGVFQQTLAGRDGDDGRHGRARPHGDGCRGEGKGLAVVVDQKGLAAGCTDRARR